MFSHDEISKRVDAEILKAREAERRKARPWAEHRHAVRANALRYYRERKNRPQARRASERPPRPLAGASGSCRSAALARRSVTLPSIERQPVGTTGPRRHWARPGAGVDGPSIAV